MDIANQNGISVECSNLRFSYPDGTAALNKINLTINTGQKVGIIGPNGAGKSTFLSLLNGIRKSEGFLAINGLPVNQKNSSQIKALVGLVFQNPDDQLFCPTIYEDVAFGPFNLGLKGEEIENCVADALLQVGLQGYGKRASLHLSFGERKLAAIATILAMAPQVIALDEPSSNLDPKHRRKIIDWIKKTDKTFIITSHDLDMLLDTCQRIIILNKGQIIADGDTAAILTDRKLLEDNDLELPLRFTQGQAVFEKQFPKNLMK